LRGPALGRLAAARAPGTRRGLLHAPPCLCYSNRVIARSYSRVGSYPLFLVLRRGHVDRRSIIRTAWHELEPHLRDVGYELVEVELGQQGSSPVLRLFIDKAEGVTLDDCAAASQVLSPVLDSSSFMEGRYLLEVSSPGFDRPVRKPEHFEQFAGERVKVKVHTPVQGRKRFSGILKGIHDGLVVVECDGAVYEIHLENLDKANLDR
jgi:ribosome maturation factor RimP